MPRETKMPEIIGRYLERAVSRQLQAEEARVGHR